MYKPFRLNKKAKHKIVIAIDLSLNNTGVAIAIHKNKTKNVISFGDLPFHYGDHMNQVDPSAFVYDNRDVLLTFKKMVGQFTRTFHDLSDFKVKEIEVRIETPTYNFANVNALQSYIAGALINEFYNTIKTAYKWLNKVKVVTIQARQWQVQTLGFKEFETRKGKTKERSIEIAKTYVREADHKMLTADNADAINIAMTEKLDDIFNKDHVTLSMFKNKNANK